MRLLDAAAVTVLAVVVTVVLAALAIVALAELEAVMLAEAARDAHVVLGLTEWAEFTELRPGDLATLVAQRNIVDGRSILDSELWRAAGWTYRALGVALTRPVSSRSR